MLVAFLVFGRQFCRHCPEDCREAVSSLMVAAARFSDLPELRDLRQIFFERYGNTVELFVNQKVILVRSGLDKKDIQLYILSVQLTISLI